MQLQPGNVGVLTIHARSIKEVEPGGEDIILQQGLAWLEYRSQLVTTTISRHGDYFCRDEELGLCGEATREKEITRAQEATLFRAVARTAEVERRRGICSCDSDLSSARFAAFIWRAVTRDPIRSRVPGAFNESALADAIEEANRSERFGFEYVRVRLQDDETQEAEEEQERDR